jgi:hypothetical protein
VSRAAERVRCGGIAETAFARKRLRAPRNLREVLVWNWVTRGALRTGLAKARYASPLWNPIVAVLHTPPVWPVSKLWRPRCGAPLAESFGSGVVMHPTVATNSLGLWRRRALAVMSLHSLKDLVMHSQNRRNSQSVVGARALTNLSLALLALAAGACGTEDPEPTKPVTPAASVPAASTPASPAASMPGSPAASTPGATMPRSSDALYDAAWPVLSDLARGKCMLCHLKGSLSDNKAAIPSDTKEGARAAWDMHAKKSKEEVLADKMPVGGGLSAGDKKIISDWADSVK